MPEATARQTDVNGWYEIKGNPLSKVGVFPYSGAQLGLDGDDSDKIFMVYRPEEELSSDECVDSFRLIPWVDEHELLGAAKEGLTPAEAKGIQGVIGDDVFFDKATGVLKGNVKVFSDKLAKMIEDGKRELSCGYRCTYDMTSGVFDGEKYDAIQRDIRGNHLALVKEGRMGKDIAVLDHLTFTIDSMEAFMPEVTEKKEGEDEAVTLESLAAQLKALAEIVAKLKPAEAVVDEDDTTKKPEVKAGDEEEVVSEEDKMAADKAAADAEEAEVKKAVEAGDSAAVIKLLRAKKPVVKAPEKTNVVALDSATIMREIAQRDVLAQKLSVHIGTFDSAAMTLSEVAKYGVKKLGIVCGKDQEAAVLTGFLAAKGVSKPVIANDSVDASDEVSAYLAR